MSKKMMLLALAAVSAVMFVLPAAASANWGVTPTKASFTGTGPGSLSAAGEPTITCEGTNTATGAYTDGTTGTLSLHFTKCHIVVFFITLPCSNTGNVKDATITTSGTFHNVTITNGKRGVLVTPANTTVQCENTNKIAVTGNVIGEVTKPTGACPVKTKELVLSFTLTSGSQTHKTIDGSGTEQDLTATTEGGSPVTAGLSTTATNKFTEEVTIDCSTP
jgi:hypothetical protein